MESFHVNSAYKIFDITTRRGRSTWGQGGQLPPLSFYLRTFISKLKKINFCDIDDMKGVVSLHNWSISLPT